MESSRADEGQIFAKVPVVTRMVALLRAVNVGGRKLPMADLRRQVAGLGWENVATYIQSGNLVFDAACSPADAEASLEALIRKHHGYEAPAIVRTRDQWAGYPGGNPFPEAARDTPKHLLMLVAKEKIERGRGRGHPGPRGRGRAGEEGRRDHVDPFPGRLRHLEAHAGLARQGDRLARHQPQLPHRLHAAGHAGPLMGAKLMTRSAPGRAAAEPQRSRCRRRTCAM